MNCSYKVDNPSRRICDESGSRKVSGSIDENHNHPGNTNDRPIFTRCDPVCNEHTHTDRSRPTDRPTQEKHTPTGDQKEAQGTRIYPQDRYSYTTRLALVRDQDRSGGIYTRAGPVEDWERRRGMGRNGEGTEKN